MVMARAQKEQQAKEIRERFDRAVSSVLVDFRGISVEKVTDLRNTFRAAGVDYIVVKNNLVKKALEGTPLADNAAFGEQLKGQTAVAWSYEDPSAAAKILKKFLKENEELEAFQVKGAVIDSGFMSGKEVTTVLATMPGKDEIRAQLLATLQAPAQSLVRQLGAAGQNFAYVLDARQRSLESQG